MATDKGKGGLDRVLVLEVARVTEVAAIAAAKSTFKIAPTDASPMVTISSTAKASGRIDPSSHNPSITALQAIASHWTTRRSNSVCPR